MSDAEQKHSPEIWQSHIEMFERRIDTKLTKLEAVPTLNQMLQVVFGSVIAAVALIVAIIGYGSTRFESGAQIVSYSIGKSIEAKQAVDENTKQIQNILDVLKQQQELEEKTKRKP